MNGVYKDIANDLSARGYNQNVIDAIIKVLKDNLTINDLLGV